MAIETATDRALFMDAEAFGTAATWTVEGGEPVALYGIWTEPHATGAPGDGPGVSLTAPVLTVFAADLPEGAAAGDAIDAKGKAWVALDIEPDGSGLVRVPLQNGS